jgi:hypothetical protein
LFKNIEAPFSTHAEQKGYLRVKIVISPALPDLTLDICINYNKLFPYTGSLPFLHAVTALCDPTPICITEKRNRKPSRKRKIEGPQFA